MVGVKGAAEMVKSLFFFPEISVFFIEFSLKCQGTLTSGLAKPMKIAQVSHISILFQPQLESEEPSLLSVQVRNFKENSESYRQSVGVSEMYKGGRRAVREEESLYHRDQF